jgi:hypothetical protein|nr:MAG TPA: hypothetical protein [Caudoviricetes sp.]
MSRIKIYFMKIVDLNDGVHQIKSDNYEKICAFVKRHKGSIKNIHSGNKLVSEKKYLEMKKEENFK